MRETIIFTMRASAVAMSALGGALGLALALPACAQDYRDLHRAADAAIAPPMNSRRLTFLFFLSVIACLSTAGRR